jgi:sulfur-oxidizing protein SoxB
MMTRRSFLKVVAATAAATGLTGRLARAAVRQRIGQQDLLAFAPKGQLTILHMADCHAQLMPL